MELPAFDRVRERFMNRHTLGSNLSTLRRASPASLRMTTTGTGHTALTSLRRDTLLIQRNNKYNTSSSDTLGFLLGLERMGIPIPSTLDVLRSYIAKDFRFCDVHGCLKPSFCSNACRNSHSDEASVACLHFLQLLFSCNNRTGSQGVNDTVDTQWRSNNAGTEESVRASVDQDHHEHTFFLWPVVEMAEFEASVSSMLAESHAISHMRCIVILTGLPKLSQHESITALKDFLGQSLFKRLGLTVKKIHLPKDSSGTLTGCVFVTFVSEADAKRAAHAVDGLYWPCTGTVTGLINRCIDVCDIENSTHLLTSNDESVPESVQFSVWGARPYHHYSREQSVQLLQNHQDHCTRELDCETMGDYQQPDHKGHGDGGKDASADENLLSNVNALRHLKQFANHECNNISLVAKLSTSEPRKERRRKQKNDVAEPLTLSTPPPPHVVSDDVNYENSNDCKVQTISSGDQHNRLKEHNEQLLHEVAQYTAEIASMQRRLKAAQYRLNNYTNELADAERTNIAQRSKIEEYEAIIQQFQHSERDMMGTVRQLETTLEAEKVRFSRMQSTQSSESDHSILWKRSVNDWIMLGIDVCQGFESRVFPRASAGTESRLTEWETREKFSSLAPVHGSDSANLHQHLPRNSNVINTYFADWETNLESALLKIRSAKSEVISLYKQRNDSPYGVAQEEGGNNLCCICREVTKSILLLPCRHLCVCEDCGERCYGHNADRRQVRCPVCRTSVLDMIRVFS